MGHKNISIFPWINPSRYTKFILRAFANSIIYLLSIHSLGSRTLCFSRGWESYQSWTDFRYGSVHGRHSCWIFIAWFNY